MAEPLKIGTVSVMPGEVKRGTIPVGADLGQIIDPLANWMIDCCREADKARAYDLRKTYRREGHFNGASLRVGLSPYGVSLSRAAALTRQRSAVLKELMHLVKRYYGNGFLERLRNEFARQLNSAPVSERT